MAQSQPRALSVGEIFKIDSKICDRPKYCKSLRSSSHEE